MTTPHLPAALPGEIEQARLDNGLEVALVRNAQAPIVSTALVYRAGARDEDAGLGGTAHFLEHMMFKGSELYPAGAVDRRTQALGGSNNAFTSHDLTVYWFSFAADRWGEALAIEADRMRGLQLDEGEVDAERKVILEEIAMYRDDPWDALEEEVRQELYGSHAYGRSVLGTAAELASTGREELARFHLQRYRPDSAVLVVAGAVADDALERIERAFGALPSGAAPRPGHAAPVSPGNRLVERRRGEVGRLLIALPAPAVGAPDHAELRLLATVLGDGRASRLQRALVEEGQLCLGVSASVEDSEAAASFAVGAELLPAVEAQEVERRVTDELMRLGAEKIGEAELERARSVFLADWVFEHDRIHQQAVAVGVALAQHDLGQPDRMLRRALEASAEDLLRVASRWLDPRRDAVIGRSLPQSRVPSSR